MGSREVTRRNVLNTGATLATVGAVGSLSGCSEMTDGDNGSDDGASGAASDIPARANTATSLRVTALLDDQPLRDAVNEALADGASESSMFPSTVAGALDMIEEEAGTDPRNVNEVVGFSETTIDEEEYYAGWLAYTDWSAEEITTLMEEQSNSDLETEEYNGVTVYAGEDKDGEAAVLDDGTIVAGKEGATRDVIDIRAGDGEPMSGEMLAAWNAASGEYMTFAATLDPEDLPDGQAGVAEPTIEKIEYTSGSVYADGDNRGVEIAMETGSEEDASDVGTFVDGLLAQAEERSEDPRSGQFFSNTEVSTSGTTVTVRNEVGVDVLQPIVTEMVSSLLFANSGDYEMDPMTALA